MVTHTQIGKNTAARALHHYSWPPNDTHKKNSTASVAKKCRRTWLLKKQEIAVPIRQK